MSSDDWKYCVDIIAFMKPLYLLVKELEGKYGSGTHGYVSDVLPAYNIMREHMQNQLCGFTSNKYLQEEDAKEERSRLQINTMNADAKLLKYRLLLTSPVYYAAVVLIPWMKWEYFEEHLDSAEFAMAQSKVQKLWENQYAQLSVGNSSVNSASIDQNASKVSPRLSRILHFNITH